MELDYTVVQDSVRELLLEMSSKTGIFWGYGHGTSGSYSYVRNECLIGSDALSNGSMTGFVDTVDYISMHKQCFHEYRHWQQYNHFFGKKFIDDFSQELVEQMAIQSMIADSFPNYVRDVTNSDVLNNYFGMIMEIDAEECALVSSKKYLLDKGLISFVDVELGMCREVNRRLDWWGQRPVDNIDDAILDLGCRKKDFRHLSLVFDYIPSSSIYAPIYKSFVSDSGNMARYLSMSDDEQDQFLIDYICKHDVRVANRYSKILGDKFPVLSAVDKVKRRSYMVSHNMFDENQYSGDVSVGRPVSDKIESVYDAAVQSQSGKDSDGYDFYINQNHSYVHIKK